jgi:hypothetical protein
MIESLAKELSDLNENNESLSFSSDKAFSAFLFLKVVLKTSRFTRFSLHFSLSFSEFVVVLF